MIDKTAPLASHPGDDTPVCTRQLCSFQDTATIAAALATLTRR